MDENGRSFLNGDVRPICVKALKKVLIVTNSGDEHSDLLVESCKKYNFLCSRYNTDHYRFSGNATWSLKSGEFHLFPTTQYPSSERYDLIIYRRPVAAHSRRANLKPWISGVLDSEWDVFEKSFSFQAKTVVNPVHSLVVANSKINQLRAAQNASLNVPDTIVSSNVEVLRAFASKHECITKAIGFSTSLRQGVLRTGRTQPVTLSDLDGSFGLGYPALLQKRIQPAAMWRIVTVGRKSFGFRMWGEELISVLDSRFVENKLMGECRPIPRDLEAKIQHMHSAFGICYASSDFIEDHQGSLWFLDLNPEGQWGEYQQRFNVNISDEIVRL